jgi:hypothetical protein
MNTLHIEKTDRTPEIRFSDCDLLIWGTFVPIDPDAFYLPLLKWVSKYSIAPARVTVVDIGLKYTRGYAMNYIEKLLQEVILLNSDQHHVIIIWYFSANSIDVKAGMYLSRKLSFPFNFVEVEEIL